MKTLISTYKLNSIQYLGISIINLYIILGLVRLTNLNFVLSNLLGFETVINETGGNAFNFINYLGSGLLLFVIVSKVFWLRTNWNTLWPFFVLFIIYSLNALMAPYTNITWYFYQIIFLSISVFLHIYTSKVSTDFTNRFKHWGKLLFGGVFLWVLFSVYQILNEYSLSYYLAEYNDAFVHALDDFGIMKQRFGYLLGFLVSYLFFYVRSPYKYLLLLVILFAGFGIRSFIIGLLGSSMLFALRKPVLLIPVLFITSVGFYFLIGSYFENIIYDTRFYSFLNAYDIIVRFPFGVGLGGYPVYTEMYNVNLFAAFYNVNAILDFIPAAPESDLVHVFGSLGLVGGMLHLLIQFRIIFFTVKFQNSLNTFEKTVLFYFCFMTFFGISEDSMFSINYWIFFGIASGIIASQLRKSYKSE